MSHGKIVVEHLFKVFGPDPKQAIRLLEQGHDKDRILADTGNVIGVCDVSFSVQEGEIFVLMGLSGSGKSTLIRLINRLVEPSAGAVFIDGRDIATLPEAQLIELRRRDMSMVFQSFALMPGRSVLDNAAFGLEVAGEPRAEREARAMAVLEQVGLAPFADKFPHELSGGMQQRVGLARALAVDPSLIIMDEAFSALAPLKRREMQAVLLELQRQHRRTILFVSHDIEEALRIGTRIGIMEGGRLIQVGTPQELIDNPVNDYVRNFFDAVDTSRYLTAGQLTSDDVPMFVHNGKAPRASTVCRTLEEQNKAFGIVIDEDNTLRGVISREQAAQLVQEDQGARVHSESLESVDPMPADASLEQVIERLVESPGPVPVVDEDGNYCGAISKTAVLTQLKGGQA